MMKRALLSRFGGKLFKAIFTNIKKYYVPIILFLVSLIIIWPYLRNGIIIGGGETAILFHSSYFNPFYLWNEQINFGRYNASQSNIFLFFMLWKIFPIFSIWIHSSVVFIFLALYLPGLFFYILLNDIFNFEDNIIYLPACLLYSFNIYRIVAYYQNENISFLLIFLPLFFLLQFQSYLL